MAHRVSDSSRWMTHTSTEPASLLTQQQARLPPPASVLWQPAPTIGLSLCFHLTPCLPAGQRRHPWRQTATPGKAYTPTGLARLQSRVQPAHRLSSTQGSLLSRLCRRGLCCSRRAAVRRAPSRAAHLHQVSAGCRLRAPQHAGGQVLALASSDHAFHGMLWCMTG